MPTYRIGNGLYSLREPFEANSDAEAWETGRVLFARARGKASIWAILTRCEEIDQKHCTPSVWSTRESQPQMFVNWQFVFMGIADEPWPSDIPSNLFP